MYMTYEQISEIGESFVKDFDLFFLKEKPRRPNRNPYTTPIEQFASRYLGLNIRIVRFAENSDMLALTAFASADIEIKKEDGLSENILIKPNDILLSHIFNQITRHNLYVTKRFTLAHECAHQILYTIQKEVEERIAQQKSIACYCPPGPRKLETELDWDEWQANVLAASILMPEYKVRSFFEGHFLSAHKLQSFDGFFNSWDYSILCGFCFWFGVSKTAAMIRLKHLNLLEEKSFSDFFDPLEVAYEQS